MLVPWKKSYDQPRQHIKKQRHYFINKDLSSQKYGFSSSHIWMWELDYKESWAPKYWCFWTVLLEKTLESPLDCKEIQPVNPKENQSWVFIWRIYAEAENPILWPPDEKNQLIGKDPDAGKDWRQEEKWMTRDEMVRWHHWLNGHEFEQAPGDGDGQESLVCYSQWGHRESDMIEGLNSLIPVLRVLFFFSLFLMKYHWPVITLITLVSGVQHNDLIFAYITKWSPQYHVFVLSVIMSSFSLLLCIFSCWSIADLQYFVSFRYSAKWFGYKYTYMASQVAQW